MDRETHKEYIRRLREERDNPILRRRDSNISHRHFTYYIKNAENESQPIPYHQIRNHDVVHIRHSYWSAITPKEQAFLLQRQIHSNIIFIHVLRKAGHPQTDIQFYHNQVQQLKEKLNRLIC